MSLCKEPTRKRDRDYETNVVRYEFRANRKSLLMPVSSWLAIDVGNSRIKFGLFAHDPRAASFGQFECVDVIATPISELPPWNEILRQIEASLLLPVCSIVVGSNQAGVSRVVSEWPAAGLAVPIIVRDSRQFPLTINVDHPRRVGLDRLLNAIAANQLRTNQLATVIIDSGTATTVDLVSSDGTFEGGSILPGFDLSARALNHYTDALPLLSMDELVGESNSPPTALGKHTTAAIASGIYWGQVGAVRETVKQLLSGRGESNLIITGGGSHLLAPHFETAKHVPHLGLSGLVIVAQQMAARVD